MERVRGPVVMMGNREAEGLGRGSVTNQEKKAWLQQYRQAGHDIGDLLRERERILSMMTTAAPLAHRVSLLSSFLIFFFF